MEYVYEITTREEVAFEANSEEEALEKLDNYCNACDYSPETTYAELIYSEEDY